MFSLAVTHPNTNIAQWQLYTLGCCDAVQEVSEQYSTAPGPSHSAGCWAEKSVKPQAHSRQLSCVSDCQTVQDLQYYWREQGPTDTLQRPNKKLKIFYLVDNIITLARYPSPLTLRGSWFVLKQSISRCTVRELPSLYLMSKYALTIYKRGK